MPYIKQIEKERVDKIPLGSNQWCGEGVGAITYAFYRLMIQATGPISRAGFGDRHMVLGAVDAAVREYYRKIVAPYEDKKETENGSIVFEDDISDNCRCFGGPLKCDHCEIEEAPQE